MFNISISIKYSYNLNIKIMKKLIIVLMLLISVKFLRAQDLLPSFEIYFENKSTHLTVNFQMYPVSAVYNGDNELCLVAKLKKIINNYNRIDYNSGTQILNGQKLVIMKLLPGGTTGFNFDIGTSGPPDNAPGSFSRGIYKMIASIEEPSQSGYVFLDTVIIETDAFGTQDLFIYYVDDLSLYGGEHNPGLTYKSLLPSLNYSWGPEVPTTFTNKYIRSWCPYPQDPNLPYRQKDFGNFTYSNGNTVPNPYTKFPLFSNRDCNLTGIPEQNQIFSELNSREGRITLNTTFDKKLSTPFEYPNTINQNQNVALTVEPNVLFKVNGGLYMEDNLIKHKGFNMSPYGNGMGNDLYVKSPDASINNTITTFEIASSDTYDANARIEVNQNCNIIIEQNAKIII